MRQSLICVLELSRKTMTMKRRADFLELIFLSSERPSLIDRLSYRFNPGSVTEHCEQRLLKLIACPSFHDGFIENQKGVEKDVFAHVGSEDPDQ